MKMRLQKNNILGAVLVSRFFNPDPFDPLFKEYKIKSYLKIIARIILLPLYVIFNCINSEAFWCVVTIIGKYIIPIVAPLSILYIEHNIVKILFTIILLLICFLFTQKIYARIFIFISMTICGLLHFILN